MSDDERRRRYELNVPNLPITHVLADGSEFEMRPDGQYWLKRNGKVIVLDETVGAEWSILVENRELLKGLVMALDGRS